MSGLGFMAASAAWLFLLALPLIAFYFLKLKRPRQAVPSLFLWSQVLSDSRVNSPFQRFKRNLLLLLQLLLLLLIILAAMQPFWQGRSSRVLRLPVLIDCSASMAALDKAGGTSRLDAAKAQVRKLVENMLPGQELCLITFARTARRATGFTNNRRVLLDALAGIEVEDVPSNVEAPLRMAQALALTATFGEVLLISDGNFARRADFELSLTIDYQRLPDAGPNLGITAFNATRSRGGDWDVFLSIEGSTDAEGAARIEVTQGGEVRASERVVVAKGRMERVTFRVPGGESTRLKALLLPDGFDSLKSDNTAFLALPEGRPLAIYVAPSLDSYRHALEAMADVRVFPEEGVVDAARAYDLVVTDREEDLGLEGAVMFSTGIVPADLRSLLTVVPKDTEVVDWRRNSPVLQYVELGDLVVLDQPRSNDGVGPADYENLGYDILAYGRLGPLLVERRRGTTLACHLLFHTDKSTFPYRIGFPILATNLAQIALDRAGLASAVAPRTGVLPPVPTRQGATIEVRGPGTEPRTETCGESGALTGIPAPRVGEYAIFVDGREHDRVGAGLLSPVETRLIGVETMQFSEDLEVAASKAPPLADRSLWWPLTLVGFCVMLAEWWYFQRRHGGIPR
jgi:hypothetical protein